MEAPTALRIQPVWSLISSGLRSRPRQLLLAVFVARFSPPTSSPPYFCAMSCLDVMYHQSYGAHYLPAAAYKATYYNHHHQQQQVRHAADFCCWRIWALFSLSLSLSLSHTHTNLCVKLKTTKLTMGREVIYVFGFFFLQCWKKIQKTQNDKKNKSLSLSWSRSNDVTKSESARELFLDFLKALSTSPDFCSGRPSPAFFTPRKHTSFNFGVSFEWSNSSLRLVIRLRSRVMTRNY